jgi:hypothetical protein
MALRTGPRVFAECGASRRRLNSPTLAGEDPRIQDT